MTQAGASLGSPLQPRKWLMEAASLEMPVQAAGKPKSFSQQWLLLCNLGMGASGSCTFQGFWSLVRSLGFTPGQKVSPTQELSNTELKP